MHCKVWHMGWGTEREKAQGANEPHIHMHSRGGGTMSPRRPTYTRSLWHKEPLSECMANQYQRFATTSATPFHHALVVRLKGSPMQLPSNVCEAQDPARSWWSCVCRLDNRDRTWEQRCPRWVSLDMHLVRDLGCTPSQVKTDAETLEIWSVEKSVEKNFDLNDE